MSSPRNKSASLLTKIDRQRFMTAMQYELFLTDLQLYDLDDYALMQRLAETCASDTLVRVLSELSSTQTVDLVYYAFQHYREGSYLIIRTLSKIYPADHPLQMLIQGFRNYYYDLEQKVPLNLPRLLAFQEVYARKQTEVCFQLFCRLIQLIVESPVNMIPIARTDPVHAAHQKELLQQRFSYQPSFTEFQNFTRRFGLYNQIPFFWLGTRQPETSLKEKLHLLCTLFERPQALPDIPSEEVFSFFSFVLNILLHLETMHRQPHHYISGLQGLTCVMPTTGKCLETLPGLPTLLYGLQSAMGDLGNSPVFVYDQSDANVYQANREFIAKLSHEYNCPILHLSLTEILTLAKTAGIEHLLDTTKKRSLGFGGARNCVFLLTPVLRHLFDRGHRNTTAMLNVTPTLVKQLFQNHVLGSLESAGDTIFMIDDDMEIPPSNLFCHALFSHEAAHRYSCSASYAIGRATKFNILCPSLEQILYNTKSAFASQKWSTEICSASMSEYVSKPKICLNLPFGSEEQHLRGVMELNPLLHPSIHLAGARYPTKTLPTRPWCGLEDYLNWYIPYSVQVVMTASLLDPLNRCNRCIFPWNQKERLRSFTSLRTACQFMASPEQKKEMQDCFWTNVRAFYQAEAEDMHLLIAIRDLRHGDIKSVLKTYLEKNTLTPPETLSLKKIGQIYSFYQHDASILWTLTKLVLDGTEIESAKTCLEKQLSCSFANLPLTNALYLLFHSVGLAEFNQLLENMEKSL